MSTDAHRPGISALVLAGMLAGAAGAQPIDIGDAAPRLAIEHWVTAEDVGPTGRFEPLTDLADGRIYVIDFWATWCGPCIEDFDKLSALQNELRDEGVVIVAVTEETLPHVVQFLRKTYPVTGTTHFERTSFSIAVDADESTLNALAPEEIRAVRPLAAIIDRSGRLAWISTERGALEGVLRSVVNGTWDRDAFAADQAARLGPEREKKRIMAEEDWPAAERQFWNDSEFLTRIAFGMAFNYSGAVKNTDPETAERFVRRAVSLTERRDPYALHTLARVVFNAGDVGRAVRLQREAIARADEGESRAYDEYYRSSLAEYEAALAR